MGLNTANINIATPHDNLYRYTMAILLITGYCHGLCHRRFCLYVVMLLISHCSARV